MAIVTIMQKQSKEKAMHPSTWKVDSANYFALWAFKITHLRDAPEPLLLATFLLTATAIGRRGGHNMEQREVVLSTLVAAPYAAGAQNASWHAGESTPKEGWIR